MNVEKNILLQQVTMKAKTYLLCIFSNQKNIFFVIKFILHTLYFVIKIKGFVESSLRSFYKFLERGTLKSFL